MFCLLNRNVRALETKQAWFQCVDELYTKRREGNAAIGYSLAPTGVSLIGHQVPQAKLRLRNDQKAMKREILKHIPIGTRIEDAQATMGTNGFKCVKRNNSSFAEMGLKGPVGPGRRGLDFVDCDLEVLVTEYCARRY